ncbi:TPA: hypothetical protein P2N00_003820 [Aeromonas salmonicida]|uniref:hypothetical protein n=2 Tax=Aeromonas salmonicida TaxID=645 RepID=UPI000AD253B7|nr:hypothetical protein [Aeromonas salmonicida]EKP0240505.1 hypothetical protein [Aeromonas salmonicida]EKP0244687.1 hypothetical protein [Aeromonas salmonicida]EKP0253176.1 hypothetical protein [Aeromonas salmonicida]EKP0257384.1 hypothetical protein [Aeromonas salmonicida]EKP0265829.1 hypothetical protein [Aeromonas salmonicida]
MAYFTTDQAYTDYMSRYELSEAIKKAQRAAHQATTEARYYFWREVEEILKSHKPYKKSKAKYLKNKEE